YEWADLVVARAGALTVSELAAAGVGAILVPFPHAIDDHQTKNAECFVAAGAGRMIAERELSAERPAAMLAELPASPEGLATLAEHARGFARLGAAERLAEACLEAGGQG